MHKTRHVLLLINAMILFSLSAGPAGYAIETATEGSSDADKADPAVSASGLPAASGAEADAQVPSIGEQAGVMVRDLNKTSEETYQSLSREAEKKKAELKTMTDDALKSFQVQLDKTMKDFNSALAKIQSSWQREAEKFRQTVDRQQAAPQPSNDTADLKKTS